MSLPLTPNPQHRPPSPESPAYLDSVVPLDRKVIIRPSFLVVYYDVLGHRLYGRGLAETSWGRGQGYSETFSNSSLEPGLHEVEVRVGSLVSAATFIAIHPEEIISLDIVETELPDGRVRVDGVGRSDIGAAVWNLGTYFDVAGETAYRAFEYDPDPTADPTPITVNSLVPPLPPVNREIYRKQAPPTDDTIPATLLPLPTGRFSLPLSAVLSLLGMVVAIQFLTPGRRTKTTSSLLSPPLIAQQTLSLLEPSPPAGRGHRPARRTRRR